MLENNLSFSPTPAKNTTEESEVAYLNSAHISSSTEGTNRFY